MIQLKRYQKEFAYSYTFGVYATLELLRLRPEQVARVLVSTKGERNAGVVQLEQECIRHVIPFEVNDRVINRLADRESHLAVGVFHKYAPTLDPTANHVVLVNPGDMGNLGTIARTMLGFRLLNLALVRPAVDIFDPKVLRASMGAVFQLDFAYFDTFADYHAQFNQQLYPLLTDGAALLGSVDFVPPYALVFGNESSGLPPEFANLGTGVRIAHSDAIDSLNLAVAVGITLYEANRR